MYEVEFAEDQDQVGPNDKRVAVLGNSFVAADGTKGHYVQHAVLPNYSLFFIDGKWYARKEQVSESIELGLNRTVKIDWSKFETPQQDIDVPYTVETEFLALTDES